MTNFEAGQIASMFFLGYALCQIPAGFLLAKRGVRGIVTLSILGFSAFTVNRYRVLGAFHKMDAAWVRGYRSTNAGRININH